MVSEKRSTNDCSAIVKCTPPKINAPIHLTVTRTYTYIASHISADNTSIYYYLFIVYFPIPIVDVKTETQNNSLISVLSQVKQLDTVQISYTLANQYLRVTHLSYLLANFSFCLFLWACVWWSCIAYLLSSRLPSRSALYLFLIANYRLSRCCDDESRRHKPTKPSP